MYIKNSAVIEHKTESFDILFDSGNDIVAILNKEFEIIWDELPFSEDELEVIMRNLYDNEYYERYSYEDLRQAVLNCIITLEEKKFICNE